MRLCLLLGCLGTGSLYISLFSPHFCNEAYQSHHCQCILSSTAIINSSNYLLLVNQQGNLEVFFLPKSRESFFNDHVLCFAIQEPICSGKIFPCVVTIFNNIRNSDLSAAGVHDVIQQKDSSAWIFKVIWKQKSGEITEEVLKPMGNRGLIMYNLRALLAFQLCLPCTLGQVITSVSTSGRPKYW